MTFAEFILQHEADDPVRLLLSRGKYPDIDLDLAVTTLEVRRKLRTKVPEWYAVPSLVYPSRLSGEQCSSSATARYKTEVARRVGTPPETVALRPLPQDLTLPSESGLSPVGSNPAGPSLLCGRGWPQVSGGVPTLRAIADLTGGMGVDAWAFAQVFREVLYNEMQPDLARATERNFKELGVGNVVFRNREVVPGKVAEVLDGFEPDVIYLDPARRAEDGRKVFLIEDCRPDVLALLPELFAASRFVLLKLSPMADITMACRRLEHVREVHVVASEGECKELLFLLDREWADAYRMFVCEGDAVMEIPGLAGNDGDRHGRPDRPSFGVPREGDNLFEPGKALMKAGAFGLPCTQFGLVKLGLHTHLYVGKTVPEGLKPFGKCFCVLEVLPMGNKAVKDVGKRYPQAEVTAKNLPLTSDQLRKKLGCASGGDVHVFGVRIDAAAGNYLIVSKRISYGND